MVGEIKYPYSVSTVAGGNSVDDDIAQTIAQWRSTLAGFNGDHRPLQQEFIDAWKANGPWENLPSLRAVDAFRRAEYTWGISLQAFLLAHPVSDDETKTLKRAMIGAFAQVKPDMWWGETWLEQVLALRRYPVSPDWEAWLPFDSGAAKLIVNAMATVTAANEFLADEDADRYFARIYNSIADAIAGEVDGSFSYEAGIQSGRNIFPSDSRNLFKALKGISVSEDPDKRTVHENVAAQFLEQKRALAEALILLCPGHAKLAEGDFADANLSDVHRRFEHALYELVVDRHIRAEYQPPIEITRQVVAAIKSQNLG